MNKMLLAAAAATAMISSAAYAIVNVDLTTGIGFVGKGDVQLVYGYNNKTLNDVATRVDFRFSSESITETTWECINERNEQIQERQRTTTLSRQGLLTTVVRDNKTKQVTGFNLTGFDGATTSTSTTDGPPLNSCPNANSSFIFGSSSEITEEGAAGGFEVTNGLTWDPIG